MSNYQTLKEVVGRLEELRPLINSLADSDDQDYQEVAMMFRAKTIEMIKGGEKLIDFWDKISEEIIEHLYEGLTTGAK